MRALTIRGHAAAAPEDGAVEEADEQRHEHAHEVVGGAAPVRQPELARQSYELGEPRGRIRPPHLQLRRDAGNERPLQMTSDITPRSPCPHAPQIWQSLQVCSHDSAHDQVFVRDAKSLSLKPYLCVLLPTQLYEMFNQVLVLLVQHAVLQASQFGFIHSASANMLPWHHLPSIQSLFCLHTMSIQPRTPGGTAAHHAMLGLFPWPEVCLDGGGPG